jgi:HlyD family secretion protein
MPDRGERPGATGDVRLTYQELGARLRISAEAARTLTRRRGWQRLAPNRKGAPAIVVVPLEELDAEDWRPDQGAPLDSERSPPNSREDRAEQRAVEAGQRADAALAVADRALAQLAEAQAAVTVERSRVAELQRDLDAARAAAQEARDAVEALRQAEADRKARGLVARLRAALRGE